MALVPDSAVHCSRPQGRNLDLSSSYHAQGPWIGFIYILYDTLFAQYRRSPLAELGTAPVIRRGQRRAAVWVGRGATARPRKAEWSSRLAAVFWVRHNQSIFKDPNGHNTTSQAYYDIIRIPLRISCCCRQLHPCYWYRLYRLYILTRDFFPHGIVGRLSKHFLFFFSQKEKTVGGCGVHRAPQSVRPDVEQAADH